MSSAALTRQADPAGARSLGGNLGGLLAPWRARAAAVAVFVLAAASFELAPPFIVRVIVDEHLVDRRAFSCSRSSIWRRARPSRG
jgi:hypothetical protein